MRRISIARPNQKVRNPARHLRALKTWADSFDGYYPQANGRQYQNYKIWTLDRLIEGPTSKIEWQREAINQLLNVAEHLLKAKPESEQGCSWVAVLLTVPDLFSSEVTVFFDKEYYQHFRMESNPISNKSILEKYGLQVNVKLREQGDLITWEDEDDSGTFEQWLIGEPI